MKKFLLKNGLTAVVVGLILHGLLVASLAQTTSPKTYYLSPSGSDSYSCAQATSEATPKETINNAITCLRPGETLLIKDGTYIAQNQLVGIPSGISWTAPVTIAAYPGSHPVLYAQQSGYDVIQFVGNSYIIIDGLIIDAAGGKNGVAITSPDIDPPGSGHHIRIINCEIRNAPFHGILVAGVNAQFNEFINLDVHDNGVDPVNDHGIYVSTSNNLIEGSAFFRNASHGIHIHGDTPNNNVVRFNLSYDNSRTGAWGAGIGIYTGRGNLVYNNIVWGNNDGLWINYDVSDSKVYNNTIYSNADYGLLIGDATTGGGTTNNIIRNNIVIGGRLGVLVDAGIATTLSNNLTTDPKFVNAAEADFHLQAGSPAIDAGIAIAEVYTDFDGIARPQGTAYDIGAYEYAHILPPPAAPSSSTATAINTFNQAPPPPPPSAPTWPSAPINLVAQCSADGTQATVSWNGVNDATAYALRVNYLGNDGPGCLDGWYCSNPLDKIVENYGGTSYAANVTPSQPYNFWVHAMLGGNYGDAGSFSFRCDGPPPPSAPTWPSAPINLVAQCSADGTQATVSWNGVNDATAYALRVNYLGNDGPGCLDGWYCSNPLDKIVENYGGTSYAANVTPSQPYNFWVHAMLGGNYGYAGSFSFRCDGPPPPSNPPLPISSLNLTWQDNSTNEDGFQIERKIGTDGLYIPIASVAANYNFYLDTVLVSGTTYCYRVRSFNSSEISGYTNEACATAP